MFAVSSDIPVVILAGGYGTRFSEETMNKPKPMIEIGNKPIILHIIDYYHLFGLNNFIVCGGYKIDYIFSYFSNLSNLKCKTSDDNSIVFQLKNGVSIRVVDTGLDTMTGGRVKRISPYVKTNSFFMTYGDGVSDVDIKCLLETHEKVDSIITLTSIHPASRFGVLEIDETGRVNSFREKSQIDGDWINGGFMIINKEIFNFIDGDNTTFEKEPMNKVCEIGKLYAYKHYGFWQCMDTLRDKNKLEQMIANNEAPWIKESKKQD